MEANSVNGLHSQAYNRAGSRNEPIPSNQNSADVPSAIQLKKGADEVVLSGQQPAVDIAEEVKLQNQRAFLSAASLDMEVFQKNIASVTQK